MNFDRKELIRQAWKTGHLSYKLRPHQLQVYNAIWKAIDTGETSYTVLCSRRFGKGFIALLVAFEYCIRNPGSRVPFAIPVSTNYNAMYSKSISSIMADIPLVRLDKNGGTVEVPDPTIAPTINKVAKTIVFPNDSWIQISGVEKENYVNLRGASASLAFVDEAAFMTNLKNVIDDVLYPMTLDTNGLIVNITTPPESLDHHFVKVFKEDSERGNVSVFTIDDNTYLNAQQRQRTIKKYTNPQYPDGVSNPVYQREFLCKFVRDENLTIVPEWEDKYICVAEKDNYYNFWHRYLGMDVGVTRDLTVCLFGHYNFNERTVYIEDEIQMNGPEVTTQKLAQRIKAKEKELWGEVKPYRRIADSSNPQLILDMGYSYQLPFIPVKKDKLDTREGILVGMINKVRVMVSQGRIKVDPKCLQTIGCLQFAAWDKNKNQLARSDTYMHFDALMALVYLIKMLDEYSNPIPQMYGYNNATQHMSPQEYASQQQSTSEWSKLFGKKNNK